MTTEDIDRILREVHDYEQKSFGVKYGPDFPSVGEALSRSKQFTNLDMMQLAMALLCIPGAKSPQDLIDNSPLRNGLVLAFYAGYRLGQREQEIRELEKMGQGGA